MTRTATEIVLAALICWGAADGQTAGLHPAFEVASVKQAPPYVDGADYQMRGGPGRTILDKLRIRVLG